MSIAQEIYDSYGDAGLKGSVPTGPDGSTFKYAPTNAEDIFEQARPLSQHADVRKQMRAAAVRIFGVLADSCVKVHFILL